MGLSCVHQLTGLLILMNTNKKTTEIRKRYTTLQYTRIVFKSGVVF